MCMRIQFWREVNSNGHASRSVLRAFYAPDEVLEERALNVAKSAFCTENQAHTWDEKAHGYDVERHVDDRRKPTRQHEIAQFWKILEKHPA